MPAPALRSSARLPKAPRWISSETELDEALTRPRPSLVKAIKSYTSPLVVLGAGGKMGPTLAVMARRAAERAGHRLEIIAVSRFTDSRLRPWLEDRGVRTWDSDLLDPRAVGRLPDATNLVYLVGLKFGTSHQPATTWAINTLVPARICERYPQARIVALSTGNVYRLSPVARGGAVEMDSLTPRGEYANAAIGRERIFEYYSRAQGTRVALLRLSYAVELRYGVLVDLARKIHAGEPVSLANGYFNCIWQADANEAILRSLPLADSPPSGWNLCRPEAFSVRQIALELGRLLGRSPRFTGRESATALLSNPAKLIARLGELATTAGSMLRWIAHWIKLEGRYLDKPTHFEVRDGQY